MLLTTRLLLVNNVHDAANGVLFTSRLSGLCFLAENTRGRDSISGVCHEAGYVMCAGCNWWYLFW